MFQYGKAVGATAEEIDIKPAARQMLADIRSTYTETDADQAKLT